MTTTDPTQPHICTADGGPACPGHTPPPLPPEPDPGPYLIGEFFALRRDGAVVVERWLSISIAEGGHRWSSWEDLAREAGCPDVPIRRLVPAPEPVTLPWHLSSINGWGSGGVRLAADNPAAPVGYSIEDQVRFMSIAEARAMAAALLSAADVAERAAVATGRPPRVDGADLVIRDLRQQLVAARQETARVRSQLAEARDALDQYATQMEYAATFAAQSRAWSGQIIALYERHADRLRRMLTATAPETGPESPHTADPAPERVEASTEHLGDADGAVAYWRAEISEILAAWLGEEQRTGWQRLASDVAEQILLDLDIADMAAERDRLRAEVKRLSARVREWEAVHADLAARCDSGDIPIRLGERYSQAVLREIDRLRADDLAIRRLLRDHGVSVGGVDPLPAVVAETLDAVAKSGAELVELRDRHEQVCEELAEARRGCERLRRENADLRAQLAEARQQRDQATEALVQAETERDEARDRLRTLIDEVWRHIGQHDCDSYGACLARIRDRAQALATTAPETAPESPQTGEQAQVRGESHTEPAGTVDDALHRIALHRIADHLGIPPLWISPAGTAWRVIAEIDRLRAERDALRAAYEPLLAQVTDWHTRLQAMWLPAAMGAVAELREEMGAALGSTPDTGSAGS